MAGVTEKMEPESALPNASAKERALLSIAVSMKRIADTAETAANANGFASLEQMFWNLGQAFGRGMGAGR